jgi:proteic killer suppression protein
MGHPPKWLNSVGHGEIAIGLHAILNAAIELANLTVPPGNRLEALTKGRKGQHSIRVNDQYRVCFRWSEGNAHDVEVVDYH